MAGVPVESESRPNGGGTGPGGGGGGAGGLTCALLIDVQRLPGGCHITSSEG